MAAKQRQSDIRYTSPICTASQAARLAEMPVNTVRAWTRPTATRPAIVHTIENSQRGWPTVPLVGVIETWSMRALRKAGIPMQKLTRVAEQLREELNDPYVLARPLLFTDGVDLYRRDRGDLFRIEDGQQPIEQVIQNYLSRVELDDDREPKAFKISLTNGVELSIDPRFNAGRPSFERNRIPVFAVLGALRAGEPSAVVASDYDLSAEEVHAVEVAPKWLTEVA
ncbi:DUF433 domain-containing protein [Rhodococcus aetherivorans]|uniref:DUF433 domain-containing protein n=1 Tax=Rhodococcus aetherivorans TaxID=191292 RepID=A0AA46NTJ4_9NOCA|nr:DUF433 domain-containing protein [Rhodococcus aetherivorans]UYF92429.1 DUF433 domain-containing protein [Rhodococcus aetherivorans]